ncbi:MAG: c-type cytochrome, partial [Pseudomonadota bacterium]
MNKFLSTGFRSAGIAVAALTTVVVAHDAAAQNIAAGAAKADSCTGCHGIAGISEYGDWPSLRGQKAEYLVTQLTDYREGRRENPIMKRVAQALSDADIADLAAYFSSLALTPPLASAEGTRLRIRDVNGGIVIMLAGPSSADPAVANLKSGSPVTELERSGDWVRVRAEPSVEGWIHASLLVEETGA